MLAAVKSSAATLRYASNRIRKSADLASWWIKGEQWKVRAPFGCLGYVSGGDYSHPYNGNGMVKKGLYKGFIFENTKIHITEVYT